MSRPSPPFAASSSLGDRRSLASAEGEDTSPRLPSRKRYSSSFGHRYATSGGGASDGSPGSTAGTDRKDGERSGGSGPSGGRNTPAFLGPTTDDDDISLFVQEIDARKPLGSGGARRPLSASPDVSGGVPVPVSAGSPGMVGGRGTAASFELGPSGPTSGTASGSGGGGAGAALGLGLVAGEHARHVSEGTTMSASEAASKRSSTMGPMLTREAEVDEKLRHMHEVFLASLEGLGSGSGSGSGRRRDSVGGGSASGMGRDSVPGSPRPSSREGGSGGGVGMGLPSGLGRERQTGSPRSVSAMEARQAGVSGSDSPRRVYGE